MRTLDGELYLGWPPERVVDLNGWRCGLDRGATRRPNSIWPFAWQPHRPLAAGIQAAERLYREAGLRPCFRITPAAAPAGLAPALAARGYAREGASHVLVAEPCSLGTTPPRRGALAVSLDERPGPGWLACYEEGLASAAEGIALCGLLARIAAPHVFAAVTVEGRAASTALAVATRTCVQISAVRTLPACRRHGLAGSVLSALQDWARARGARQLALMVEATNAPALALYRKAGFHRAYDYHYLAPAAP
jgi:ribosomal protein S18 acetylase RimI-like enzyme